MSEDETSENSEKPVVARLIDAAGQIFASKGPTATVREICSAAKCSVAAINYYFGDKQQLYARCVQTACERKQQLFPIPNLEDSDDYGALLRAFLQTITRRMTAKANVSWHNTLMLREVISPSQGIHEILEVPFKRDLSVLSELIGRLLGSELDSIELRQSLVTQIVARSMFLRTGKSLRQMIDLDVQPNEDPETYANEICHSVLLQIDAMRAGKGLPRSSWSSINNDSSSALPIEDR